MGALAFETLFENGTENLGVLASAEEIGEAAQWASTLAVRNRFIGKLCPFDQDDLAQEVAILTVKKVRRAEFRHGGKLKLNKFAYFAACCCLSNHMNAKSKGRLWMKANEEKDAQRRLFEACLNYIEKENEAGLRRVAAAIFAIATQRGHDAYECETLNIENLQGAFE